VRTTTLRPRKRPKAPKGSPAADARRYCDQEDRQCEHASPFGRCMLAGPCVLEGEQEKPPPKKSREGA